MKVVPTVEISAQDITAVEEARFWSLVKIDWLPNACWLWIGEDVTGAGYGRFKWSGHRVSANRFAFALANGFTPSGIFVCHSCDNPRCVRFDHLNLGSATQNMKERDKRGRQARGSRTGTSILIESQVLEIRELLAVGISTYKIGAAFGVSRHTIQKIKDGVNWSHLR